MASPGSHAPATVVQVTRLTENSFIVRNAEWHVWSTRLPVNAVTRPTSVNHSIIGRQGCKNILEMFGTCWREGVEPQVMTPKTHLTLLNLTLFNSILLPIVPIHPTLERLENFYMKISN